MSMTNTKAAGGIIIATATIANNQAVGSIIPMNLKWNPSVSPEKEVIIPANELWELKDAYCIIAGDAAANFLPQINVKKDQDRIMDVTEILSAIVISNQSRPNGLHANIRYEGASHMSMDLVVNGTNATGVNVRVIFPFEKSG